jgi:hypothetical protein
MGESVRERFPLTRYLEQYLDLFGALETVFRLRHFPLVPVYSIECVGDETQPARATIGDSIRGSRRISKVRYGASSGADPGCWI